MPTYTLIADAGSTKVEWCVVDAGTAVTRFTTEGINPVMLSDRNLLGHLLCDLAPHIEGLGIARVNYYGAGCRGVYAEALAGALASIIPDAEINVASDMLGAARALCGTKPGIACILGTGSNSCLYDGHDIVDSVPSLGYVLGDEGSGAYLGRKLVSGVLKRQLPDYIRHDFSARYGLSTDDVIEHVYRRPAPNKFLAGLTYFIADHIDDASMRELVFRAFDAFFKRNVCAYDGYADMPVGFVGSIAYTFADILADAADFNGCRIDCIIKAPLDGLLEFVP